MCLFEASAALARPEEASRSLLVLPESVWHASHRFAARSIARFQQMHLGRRCMLGIRTYCGTSDPIIPCVVRNAVSQTQRYQIVCCSMSPEDTKAPSTAVSGTW